MNQKQKNPGRSTKTILLAEDDDAVRNMVLSLLESSGYEVIVAVDGEIAVQKFREHRKRIRLLLFDVVMPNKNGIEAYNEIKELEPDMKVIFASAYATEAVHLMALSNSNITSLSKPYLPSNLLSIVRTVLDTRRNISSSPS